MASLLRRQPPEFLRGGGIRLDSILDCESKDLARMEETEKKIRSHDSLEHLQLGGASIVNRPF
jgi:hypothetical protein